MGILGFFNSEEEKRASEVRKGTVAPTRAERQRCWESRDLYFSCLDKHDIIDALKEDKKAAKECKAESAKFEENCAEKWVSSVLFARLRLQLGPFPPRLVLSKSRRYDQGNGHRKANKSSILTLMNHPDNILQAMARTRHSKEEEASRARGPRRHQARRQHAIYGEEMMNIQRGHA